MHCAHRLQPSFAALVSVGRKQTTAKFISRKKSKLSRIPWNLLKADALTSIHTHTQA